MPTFAERVRELRLQRKMNQKQLADELDVSKSRIAMYEQDKRKPDFQFLELMADYFNVDVDYLMGKTDTPNRYQEELKSAKTSSVESSNSSHLLSLYKCLSPKDQALLLAIAERMAEGGGS